MSIIVKPINGLITKDKDVFGKMDPYVVCMIGQEKKKGNQSSGSGTSPQWSDTFVFNQKDQIMRVQVWDKDTFSSDDLVGEGTVNINQLYMYPNKKQSQYVDLMKNGKSTGRIQLEMEYQGPAMQQGWNNQQQGGWGNQQQGWGNQQPQQNWGNQGPQQGWGNQQQGWGNQQPQQNWGNQQQGWGNQQPQQNWGNQGPQQGWGNQQQQGWGNQQQQGWGNQGPPPNWSNNGWGPNGPPGGNQGW